MPPHPATIATRHQQPAAQPATLAKAAPTDAAKLDALKATRKRWSAAEINTRALAAATTAAANVQQAATQFETFTAAAAALTASADQLNAKRAERRQFATVASQRQPPPAPEIQAEIDATLAALDAVINRHRETHLRLEREALGHRTTIEQSAAPFQTTVTSARSLRQAYLDALK